MLLRIARIDRVEAGADTADDPDFRARREYLRVRGRIGDEQRMAAVRLTDNVINALALRHLELDAGGGEKRALYLDIGKTMIRKQDFHRASTLSIAPNARQSP